MSNDEFSGKTSIQWESKLNVVPDRTWRLGSTWPEARPPRGGGPVPAGPERTTDIVENLPSPHCGPGRHVPGVVATPQPPGQGGRAGGGMWTGGLGLSAVVRPGRVLAAQNAGRCSGCPWFCARASGASWVPPSRVPAPGRGLGQGLRAI